jgi:tetratricopeptide (TPR) repeat protein
MILFRKISELLPELIIAMLLTLVAGCSNKSAGNERTELKSNAEMLAAGLKFRTDPLDQTVACQYINLLVEEKQFVAALTILDELANQYPDDERFSALYSEIIRKAASNSVVKPVNAANFRLQETDAETDTLIMRLNRISSISRRIGEEGPGIDLYLDRGILLLQLSDFEGAGFDFNRAFQMDASHYLSFYYNIYIYYGQGKFTEAMDFLYKHVNTINFSDEKSRETIKRMEQLLKSLRDLDNKNDLDEKTRCLEKAKLLLSVKDYRQAMEQVNKAVHLDEKYGDAYALRALVYREMNLREQALADLEIAEQISGKLNTPLANKIRNDTLYY